MQCLYVRDEKQENQNEVETDKVIHLFLTIPNVSKLTTTVTALEKCTDNLKLDTAKSRLLDAEIQNLFLAEENMS